MKMREDSEEDLLKFLGDLVEDRVEGRTQVRFSRAELEKLTRSFLKGKKISASPSDTLEAWAETLNHSLFFKNYLIKYIPAVDSVSFQWVAPWESIEWAA